MSGLCEYSRKIAERIYLHGKLLRGSVRRELCRKSSTACNWFTFKHCVNELNIARGNKDVASKKKCVHLLWVASSHCHITGLILHNGSMVFSLFRTKFDRILILSLAFERPILLWQFAFGLQCPNFHHLLKRLAINFAYSCALFSVGYRILNKETRSLLVPLIDIRLYKVFIWYLSTWPILWIFSSCTETLFFLFFFSEVFFCYKNCRLFTALYLTHTRVPATYFILGDDHV